MSKSHEMFNKKELQKKKKKKQEEKAQRREQRKELSKDGSLESMMAYVDENGNISSTPPDPTKKKDVDIEDIQIGVSRREDAGEPLNRSGVVTFFNESKGYGFIKDANTNESIFTHVNSHLTPVKENDRVTYIVERGPKGLNAVQVKVIS